MKLRKAVFLSLVVALALMGLFSRGFSSNVVGAELVQFKVYRVTDPSVTEEYVLDVATRVFNMTNPVVNYSRYFGYGHYKVTDAPNLSLYVDEASGFFIYDNGYSDSIVVPSSPEHYEPPDLPSKAEARIIAESFLTTHGLMPERASFTKAYNNTISIYDIKTKTEWNVTPSVSVGFRLDPLDGIPIDGSGAEISVKLGDGGEIVEVFWTCRNIDPNDYEYRSGLSEAEATAEFLAKNPDVNFTQLNVTLVYWTETGLIRQEYLEPHYKIESEFATPDGHIITSPIKTMQACIIPEFPTLTTTLLILLVITVAVVFYKRRLLKTPNH